MGHAGDVHCLKGIVDAVEDAPVPHANAPEVFIPTELFASGRSRIIRQRHDFAVDAGKERISERVQLFLCGRFEGERVATHAASAFLAG